ncbi:hypothetical protein E3N88_44239 [Mikania micrantha]|uniref:Uncharacterized protein n=1 Tax=Mikania micrantha TaxID=192012 RepID=A0A5N6LCP4_9ASTR|nr:hypothetical protein E3N88_44239 [Mikania micrantha]
MKSGEKRYAIEKSASALRQVVDFIRELNCRKVGRSGSLDYRQKVRGRDQRKKKKTGEERYEIGTWHLVRFFRDLGVAHFLAPYLRDPLSPFGCILPSALFPA